jgi:hypothetical protein
MITRERLLERLDYNPETGVFTWKAKPVASWVDRRWNNRYAGQHAGYVNTMGYVAINIAKTMYLAHRLAWLYVHGELPDSELDHIDRNPSNNSISNLRQADRRTNNYNKGKQSNNTSGVKGATWNKAKGKWQVNIAYNGKNTYVGRFDTLEDAASAYEAAARRFHGEFANTGKGA